MTPRTTSDSYEYRLSWESIDSFHAAAMDARHGRGWAKQLSPEQWAALPWSEPTVKIDTNLWDQYNTLRSWAETHEEAIRNVKLERRVPPLPDEGWEPVSR